jgi:DNA-binding CsgD family transcriptional regulator
MSHQFDPSTEFLLLMLSAIMRVRGYRRVILHVGRFDMRQMRPLLGTPLDTAIERINRLLPGIPQRAQFAEAMFLTGMEGFLFAHSLWKQIKAATAIAVEAVRRQIRSFLPLLVGMEMCLPFQAVQGAGNVALAGWIDSQLSLKHNSRLEEVLRNELAIRGEYDQSPRDKLRERLPANTWRAWHEGEWKTLANLRTRIAYLVEHDISEQSHQEFAPDAPLQAAPPPLESPTYEEVARKLEEEDLFTARFKKARLTLYEEQVAQLQFQEYSDAEIADRLNKSINAIQQAWLSARRKLRRVMDS